MVQPATKRLVTESAVAGHISTQITTPGSATATALNATFAGRVNAYLDPRDFANGAVAALSTGQPVNLMGYAVPAITDGKISHTPPNNGQGGVYMQTGPFAGGVDRIGCMVEFAANTTGTVALVLPQNAWVEGSFGPAGVHTVITPSGSISTARYENLEVNKVTKSVGTLVGVHTIELTVDRIRNAIAIHIDGVLAMETIDAAAIPMVGNYAIWEFFNTAAATVVPAKILSMWTSAGGPSRIPAAVPVVANKAPNTVGVQAQHFGTGGGVSYPLSATAGYTVISPDLKMPVKYPASGKLLLHLDCAVNSATAQTILLKLAATSQSTLINTGPGNTHAHASVFITGTPFTTAEISLESWVLSGGAVSIKMGGGEGVMTWSATPVE